MNGKSEAISQSMACMEVIGGNECVSQSLETLGLECWVYCMPHGNAQAGGDVYFVSNCATGRITRLLLADISGHGADVADTGRQLSELMHAHINHLNQIDFLRQLNLAFDQLSGHGGFATAVVATFFSPDGKIDISCAGHPQPMLRRRGQWAPIKAESSTIREDFALGLTGDSGYSAKRIALKPDDCLLFFSDAVTEARDQSGRALGEEGLQKLLDEMDLNEPGAITRQLVAALQALSPANLQRDDLTVISLRYTGAGKKVPLSHRLRAPWLVLLASIRAGIRRRALPLPELTLANLGGAIFDALSRRRR